MAKNYGGLESLYKEFLDNDDNHDSYLMNNGNDWRNDEDSVSFMTEEDLAKIHNKEEELGIKSDNKSITTGDDSHFKIYNKRRVHKYTDAEMEAMKRSCESTIVNDYGENDFFHMSDEERERIDVMAEIANELAKVRSIYRKPDKYVEAMRSVMKAWAILEKGNYLHSKKEFYKLVSSGNIYSNRIVMPKLKNIDGFNTDVIAEYIYNTDLDPADLVKDEAKNDFDEWFNDFENEEEETPEEKLERLLSPEEIEYIDSKLNTEENEKMVPVQNLEKKYIKNYDQKSFRFNIKKKKKNTDSKFEKRIKDVNHKMLNRLQSETIRLSNSYDLNRSYLLSNSIFDVEKKKESNLDKVRFNGDWTKDDDVELYELQLLGAWLDDRSSENKYKLNSDIMLDNFFKDMENQGMNVIKLRRAMGQDDDSLSAETKLRKIKTNKKLEAAIIQRITKLNNNDKFKKLVKKVEKGINKGYEDD
jgi:hypothetical protein